MKDTRISAQRILIIAFLCYVNLLNYMDRFGVLAVLSNVQVYFDIDKDLVPMLPTSFLFCYIVFGILFGYLGDRRSRFATLLAAIGIWWIAALLGTFILYNYWLFMVCRLFVAIGEAGFSALSPIVLTDTLNGHTGWCRTVALGCFFAAIPIGSGMGFVINAKLMLHTGVWWWGMRTTAMMGTLSMLGVCFIEELVNGNKDVQPHSATRASHTFWDDFIYVLTNTTFMLTNLAFTTMCYMTGVLVWWLPYYVYQGLHIIEKQSRLSELDVAVLLALMMIGSGIGGAIIGGLLSGFLRSCVPNIDAIICSVGSLLSSLLLAATVLLSNENAVATKICLFFSFFALNMNWPLVGNMQLYITEHTQQCIAAAIQMLVAHGLGSIIGPYIVAILTYDHCKIQCGFFPSTQEFHVLRFALLTVFFVANIGSACFLAASYFLGAKSPSKFSCQDN